MSVSIAETTREKLKELLEYSLNIKKPTGVVCTPYFTSYHNIKK